MSLITPIYLVCLYIFNITTGNMPIFYETLFPAWFIFYMLGMDVMEGKFKRYKVKGWMIGLALIASFTEAYILIKVGCTVGYACSQIKSSSFVYNKLKSIENPGYKVAMVMTTVMKIHRSSSEKLEYMECGDLSIQQERRRSRFV